MTTTSFKRKIASVVRVRYVLSIPEADRIKEVTMEGVYYRAVVQAGRFKPGDLAVYLEVDAVPPDTKLWRFLWETKGFNVFRDLKPGVSVLNDETREVGKVVKLHTELQSDGYTKCTGVEVQLPVTNEQRLNVALESPEGKRLLGEAMSRPLFKAVYGLDMPVSNLVVPQPVPEIKVWDPDSIVLAQPRNFRVRTLRLKGVLSMGVLMLPEECGLDPAQLQVGEDLSDRLGVKVYEPPESPDEAFRAPFPGDVSKTSEARLQSYPALIDELSPLPWVATLKIDGQSLTAFLDAEGEFHVAGRKHSVLKSNVPHWQVAKTYKLESVLRKNPLLVLQGEVAGPGILKNRLGLKSYELFIYNVYNRETGTYFLDEDLRAFCKEHGLVAVPKVKEGENFGHDMSPLEGVSLPALDNILSLASGTYPGTKNPVEGVVIRPSKHHVRSPTINKWLSLKVLNAEHLLKEKD